MWKYNNTDELYHWGILGMKWGVRRYQNKDGTLTPEGKRRQKSYDYVDSRRIKKKKLSQMSNNELRRLNERQYLENQYKQNNSKIKKIAKTTAIIGTTAGIIKNIDTIYGFGKKISKTKRGQKIISKGKNIVNKIRHKG